MSARSDKMRQRLIEALHPDSMEIRDDSQQHSGHGGYDPEGSHFSVTIVAQAFRDKDTLTRHRMVYDALGEMMHNEIHALRISARSPDEF